MSTAPRQRTTWLSQMYDRVMVVVMLLILLSSALILLFRIGTERKLLTQGQWDQSTSAPRLAKLVDLVTYKEVLAGLARPFQMEQRSQRLLTSELRVSCVKCQKPIMFNAAQCPFCGVEQPRVIDPRDLDIDEDGIKDWWETKHGLNTSDKSDAQNDLDGDGFNNLEEFLAGTEPADPKDFPSPPAKLRLRRVVSEPFFLRFQGVNEISAGAFQYQLNLRTLERTYFAKIGEDVQGFKVVEYVPDAANGPTVVLQQGEKKINLVKGKAVQQEEYTAQLIFLLDRTAMRARMGDIITLKGQEYKVIDIKRHAVTIRDVKTGKDILIPPLSAGDLTAPGGDTAGSSAPDSGAPELFPE